MFVLNKNLYVEWVYAKRFSILFFVSLNSSFILTFRRRTLIREVFVSLMTLSEIFEHNVGYSMRNALAIKKNNSQTYYINFGKESNQDENKFLFILAGLEEPENTCVSRFLGEKKCQDNEVMKRFQQTNCKLTWALWQPCDNKCKDGVCVD